MEREVIHHLATGALLHDVGKIGVPDQVLNKSGRLTDAEMVHMRNHVTLGYDVLKRSGELSPISLEIVGDHHERLDGTGYPNGKTEAELSLYSRMIAIVDTYDAVTASRCYQDARSPVTAFKILRSESGKGYDPKLVAEFIKCMGIHPVGTLVKMKSNKLGIVIQSNYVNPIAPKVHVFYSVVNKSYIEPRIIDLAAPNCTDEIEKSVKPEEFKVDIIKYFKEILLN
jgi:HD-GYP domain-containing protein (c-di-GMP phosphodiesterase class II)